MKAVSNFLIGMGAVGIFIYSAIVGMILVATVYGVYLAFSVSIVLGVLCLFVQPSPLIFGLVMMFFHKNLAQMLFDFLTK